MLCWTSVQDSLLLPKYVGLNHSQPPPPELTGFTHNPDRVNRLLSKVYSEWWCSFSASAPTNPMTESLHWLHSIPASKLTLLPKKVRRSKCQNRKIAKSQPILTCLACSRLDSRSPIPHTEFNPETDTASTRQKCLLAQWPPKNSNVTNHRLCSKPQTDYHKVWVMSFTDVSF